MHSSESWRREIDRIFSSLGAVTILVSNTFEAMAGLRRTDVDLIVAESKGDKKSLYGMISLARQNGRDVSVWVLSQDSKNIEALGENVSIIVGECTPVDVVQAIGEHKRVPVVRENESGPAPLLEGSVTSGAHLVMKLFIESLSGRLVVQSPLGDCHFYVRRGMFVWVAFPSLNNVMRKTIERHEIASPPFPDVPDADLLAALLASQTIDVAGVRKAVGQSLREALTDTISLETGNFRFDEVPEYEDINAVIEFNPFALVIAAEREAIKEADAVRIAKEYMGRSLHFENDMAEVTPRLKPFSNGVDLFELKGALFSHIALQTGLDGEACVYLVNALVNGGIATFE